MLKDERTNEEVLSEMMIANHNVESVVKKMHEFGNTKELNELFEMFVKHYNDTKEEVLRRMNNYGSRQK